MTQCNKEIQEKKKSKYIRDSGDFSRGEIFKWQSKVQYPEPVPSSIPPSRTSHIPSVSTPTALGVPALRVFEYKNELQVLIKQSKNNGVLNKKESLYLDPSTCRRPIIYFLPKVHKNAQNPPGRPIVNGIDSVSARLGQYIDFFLKPLVSSTKAYLKDAKHAIQIIESTSAKDNSILVMADVGSLYTIIGHQDAVESVKWALDGSNLPAPHKSFLLDALKFCLARNYFWYNHKFFLRIRGVALGARFAPSVANHFMALWEEETIFNNKPAQLKCYQWYIDDMIIIWKGDMVSLQLFMSRLNGNTQNIRLTWNSDAHCMMFLDLEIFKEGQCLKTKNHFKPTNRNGYIPLDIAIISPGYVIYPGDSSYA